jgi:hypothetical protein
MVRMKSSMAFLFALLLLGGHQPGCDSGSSDKEETDATGAGVETTGGGEIGEGCVPECEARACGDDGCGGSCGTCYTIEGAPNPELCLPDGMCTVCGCLERDCGLDDCGSPCGTCSDHDACSPAGLCELNPAKCAMQGFAHDQQEAKLKGTPNGFFFAYKSTRMTEGGSQSLFLRIDTRDGMGGPAATGEFDAVFDNFEEGGLWLHGEETTEDGALSYMPVGGKIVLDTFSSDGGPFKARLDGVILQETVLDEGTPKPRQDGAIWCLDDVVMEAEVFSVPDVCGELAVGKQIGSTIGNFQVQRCDGEWVDLYEYCSTVSALWIVATNGW